MIDNDLDDEIIIGINRPNEKKTKSKKKKVAKKATSPNNKKVDKTKNNKKKNYKKKANKKSKKNINKKALIIVVIVLIFIGILIFLLNSSYFKIKNIEVNNNLKVTKEQLEQIAKFEKYKNMFWINSNKIENDFKNNNAYIEDAEISTKLPNTVIINLKERVPKYMLQFADSYVYINNQGYMLDVSTENINLPIILGFKTDLSNIEVRKTFRY